MKKVLIVDYGMGNIHSISSAIEFLGLSVSLSSLYEDILNADYIVMPGVGSFNLAMKRINEKNLTEPLRIAVIDKKKPILGICLGMQLLAKSSVENGYSEGLGFVDGFVEKFDHLKNIKIPHVGFSPTMINSPDIPLFNGFPAEVDFYYTHSYRMKCSSDFLLATGFNGEKFAAVVGRDNILGTQFHPELSQSNGLHLLKNFFKEY